MKCLHFHVKAPFLDAFNIERTVKAADITATPVIKLLGSRAIIPTLWSGSTHRTHVTNERQSIRSVICQLCGVICNFTVWRLCPELRRLTFPGPGPAEGPAINLHLAFYYRGCHVLDSCRCSCNTFCLDPYIRLLYPTHRNTWNTRQKSTQGNRNCIQDRCLTNPIVPNEQINPRGKMKLHILDGFIILDLYSFEKHRKPLSFNRLAQFKILQAVIRLPIMRKFTRCTQSYFEIIAYKVI